MKKYILVMILSVVSLSSINIVNAGPEEDACSTAVLGSNAVVGQTCTFTTPVRNTAGGRQSGGAQTGRCDRSNTNPDANSNPLICRSIQNQISDFETDWEDCVVVGDRCRSGGKDSTCVSRVVARSSDVVCGTSVKPPGTPGGRTPDGSTTAPNNEGAPDGSTTVPSGSTPDVTSPQTVSFVNPSRFNSIIELVAGVINALLGILGAITVAVLVMSGFKYMTSSNPGAVGAALDGIKNAIIGLMIIMGAFLITQYVISALAG